MVSELRSSDEIRAKIDKIDKIRSSIQLVNHSLILLIK